MAFFRFIAPAKTGDRRLDHFTEEGSAIFNALMASGILTNTAPQVWTIDTGALSPLTTKGDIWVYSTVDTRLAVGTNSQILVADSTAATGLKWVATSGDLTNSAGVFTIGNDKVTYAKMQNVSAASRLLGRGSAAGAGDPEEITISTGLTLAGTTLSATAAGVSPLTTKGDIWAYSTVDARFAVGSSANILIVDSAATFGFKWVALSSDVTIATSGAVTIANDAVTYAKMQNVSAASKLVGRGDSGSGDPQEITLGTNLSMSGTTLNGTSSVSASQLAVPLNYTTDLTLPATSSLVVVDHIQFQNGSALTVPSGSYLLVVPGQTFGTVFVRKTSDESVTNQTLQDDDQLLFAVAANEVWSVTYYLLVSGNTSGDFQCAINAPTGATGFFGGVGPASTQGNTSATMVTAARTSTLDDANAYGFGTSGTAEPYDIIVMHALVVNGANAGTVKLRWSQLVTNATATVVLTHSYLLARRVQ